MGDHSTVCEEVRLFFYCSSSMLPVCAGGAYVTPYIGTVVGGKCDASVALPNERVWLELEVSLDLDTSAGTNDWSNEISEFFPRGKYEM